MASSYFEKVLISNERQLQQPGRDELQRHKLKLPDWLSPNALTLFMKYLYLGHLRPSSESTPRPPFELLLDLLLLSLYFRNPHLVF